MKKILILLLILSIASLLRLYELSQYPNGLYSDEVSQGYNAFSLLKTGADEFGNIWPLTIKSFGDYKPPMSTWLNIPSVWLLGLNEFSVRLPSVLAGIITVFIVYFIAKELFYEEMKKLKQFKFIPLLAAFLFAISPWSILFSRSNMLVSIELMFTSAGFLFFLKGLKKNQLFFLSAIFFSAAIYSYYGARITVVSLIILLVIIFRKELISIKKSLILPAILGFLLLSPLIYSIVREPQTLTGRARSISIFYDEDIRLKLWEAHTLDGPNYPVILSRFFNNKPYLYFTDIVMRYMQHFSFNFLALFGDQQIPFNLHQFGIVYIQETLFFLIGIYYLVINKTKKIIALIAYLFASPIAASLTFTTPAANRSFNIIISWTIIAAVGFVLTFNYLKSKKITILSLFALSTIYLISVSSFLYTYFYTLPIKYPAQWHYGRQLLVYKIKSIENKYKKILISNSSKDSGPGYIWFLFYQKYNPKKFNQTASISDKPNKYGFLDVYKFDKYYFINSFNWANIEKNLDDLYIGYEEDIPDNWSQIVNGKKYTVNIIDRVLYPNNKTAFKIAALTLNEAH